MSGTNGGQLLKKLGFGFPVALVRNVESLLPQTLAGKAVCSQQASARCLHPSETIQCEPAVWLVLALQLVENHLGIGRAVELDFAPVIRGVRNPAPELVDFGMRESVELLFALVLVIVLNVAEAVELWSCVISLSLHLF